MHDETVLFDASSNRFCLLNGTAAFLWERLERPSTVEELSQAICGRYAGVDSTLAEQDVRTALAQFSELAVVRTAP